MKTEERDNMFFLKGVFFRIVAFSRRQDTKYLEWRVEMGVS